MKKLLIIVTHKFPFEPPTEQFLNEEIAHYSGFDIVFMPMATHINFGKLHANYDTKKQKVLSNKHQCFLKRFFYFFLFTFLHLRSFVIDFFKRPSDISFKNICAEYYQIASSLRAFKRNLRKDWIFAYDKIVLYSYWLNAYSVALSIFRQSVNENFRSKFLVVSRAHGQGDLYLTKTEKTSYRPFLRQLADIDCIFSISNDGKKQLETLGLKKVAISRLGVVNKRSFCNSALKQKNHFIVVSCSVVNENKNVKAIAMALSKTVLEIEWTHFGDGPLLEELKKWCSEHLPKNITYNFRGSTPNGEIVNYYYFDKPDVFVNVSKIEGIPVSIMEAMSYGIPCVATDVGATNEIVSNLNGFLLPKSFLAEELTSAIEHILLLDHDKSKLLSYEAHKTWKELYDADTNFEHFVKQIEDLSNEN